ncbi:TRAP transporter small permease [Mesorhizobium sp. BR1-1-9]|uniref:TRAP transporter small permease n=1 Tax=unclassified Mesorhizobium TaxID=325217 RepID=UPI001CD04EE4|nr:MULTISPECIES: TRAP transporter small permease [unclassified Mesorhizobium]MBZ9872292.1 TRAP transporter small permease [Mesorhizobium sp. BR1-1-9]MBZ9944633.1 TRAP transporter small permease [Mesorhizobium sp. BR1-1-13]
MTQDGLDGVRIRVSEEEPDPAIEHHIEDWLAFAIFWGMAIIVFLQFFTRYVLNNSLAWTEEIARYLLMIITFVGAAVAMRRGTHISVEVAHMFLPAPVVRVLSFIIDVLVLGFVGLLGWFSISITRLMQIQTMTVFPWPMSIVYGGIAIGCFLMLWRATGRFIAGARRGWRPDPNHSDLIID